MELYNLNKLVIILNVNFRDKSKPLTPTIRVLIVVAITTTMAPTIQPLTATTTIRPTATTTMVSAPHSNTVSDYMFYGIYTVKVLVLKRFIPSDSTKVGAS